MLLLRKTIGLLLLVMMFVIVGAVEGRSDEQMPKWWQEKVRKLKAEGKDVKIMRSKSNKPEKSPKEFLKRYKKIREKAGENFTFQTFVEDIARGLVVEQRYHETEMGGIFYNAKENLNPNYSWKEGRTLRFNSDKFCITLEMIRQIFGKEDRVVDLKYYKKALLYRYNYMGMSFEVNCNPGDEKKCVNIVIFNSVFFRKMENRKGGRQ